ncbi:hypothetical protein DMUE_6009 [Dictyocoela muelleri]|nr:hypothetical protein DMUE_6009 [Dictyocoela muelleri]
MIKACFNKSIIFASNKENRTPIELNKEGTDELNFMIPKLKLDFELNLKKVIDVEEAEIIYEDINDDTIVEMLSSSNGDFVRSNISVNDIKSGISTLYIQFILNQINEADI